MQYSLFDSKEEIANRVETISVKPLSQQLLKWVGNKQRFAHEIISYFPKDMKRYYEPFLGSGAVLATLAPGNALASDIFKELIQIFQNLRISPGVVKEWYRERYDLISGDNKQTIYEMVKDSYNRNPNPADLLFLSRTCYGGVIRFRKEDGYISTPVGIHNPMKPDSFSYRVDLWHDRVKNTEFVHANFVETMRLAKKGDLIYCDPPYADSQSILYGAQLFNLEQLLEEITHCKEKGVRVVLSIDGTKKSGNHLVDLPIPAHLFEREVFVNVGKSMLKRFQMNGKTLHGENVRDRLLLSY